MKAKMKSKSCKAILKEMAITAEFHHAQEKEAWLSGHSDRSIGSGTFFVYPDFIQYETGSRKGRYCFTPEGVVFEGYRRSFKDGTEYFRAVEDGILLYTLIGDPIHIKGSWELVESSQPNRGLWD